MEADWSVALAAGDPVIEVPWAAPGDKSHNCRFVDLRLGGGLIDEIEEARMRPALRWALLLLNSATSPLWTAKCDAWNSEEALDPYEMDAEPEQAAFGAGSYVDLLPRDGAALCSFARQERWIRAVTKTLRGIPARAARVEVVLRRAQIEAAQGFGVSYFVEGCGATAGTAIEAWARAMALAVPVVISASASTTVDVTMTKTGE